MDDKKMLYIDISGASMYNLDILKEENKLKRLKNIYTKYRKM